MIFELMDSVDDPSCRIAIDLIAENVAKIFCLVSRFSSLQIPDNIRPSIQWRYLSCWTCPESWREVRFRDDCALSCIRYEFVVVHGVGGRLDVFISKIPGRKQHRTVSESLGARMRP